MKWEAGHHPVVETGTFATHLNRCRISAPIRSKKVWKILGQVFFRNCCVYLFAIDMLPFHLPPRFVTTRGTLEVKKKLPETNRKSLWKSAIPKGYVLSNHWFSWASAVSFNEGRSGRNSRKMQIQSCPKYDLALFNLRKTTGSHWIPCVYMLQDVFPSNAIGNLKSNFGILAECKYPGPLMSIPPWLSVVGNYGDRTAAIRSVLLLGNCLSDTL